MPLAGLSTNFILGKNPHSNKRHKNPDQLIGIFHLDAVFAFAFDWIELAFAEAKRLWCNF